MNTKKKPLAGACPACGGTRRSQHLMCHECWALVPSVEQRAVQDTWRRFKHAGDQGRVVMNKRRTEYEQARQAAIAHAVAANEAADAATQLPAPATY